jgi:hypothetical protein
VDLGDGLAPVVRVGDTIGGLAVGPQGVSGIVTLVAPFASSPTKVKA